MKKIISLILCILLLLGSISVLTFSAATTLTLKQAIEKYEKETGETVNTKRYYFLMPDGTNGILGTDEEYMYGEYAPSWYNENATTAGVYWWGTEKIDPEIPGYKMMKGDSDSVYYADVPDFVKEMMFNNYFYGTSDFSDPLWYNTFQSTILCTDGYEENESDIYREGLESFENMIYVINPSFHSTTELEPSRTWGGEWYYYYGNGCFGPLKNGNEYNCIREDHDHENLYIKFDPRNSGWADFEKVYCIIKPQAGSSYYPEKSIPALCTDYDGDGVYTYDLNKSKIKLKEQDIYYVHFMTDTGHRTYELTMQTTNIKDTVITTGEGQNRTYTEWANKTPISIPSLTNAIKSYERENNTDIKTYRNYFLIPDGSDDFVDSNGELLPNWFNEYYTNICVNWYSYDISADVPYRHYPGYAIEKTVDDNIYYADIPVGVNAYTVNNGVVDYSYPSYSSCVSYLLGPEYNSEYKEGLTDCDNMIFVFEEMDRYSMTTTAMCTGQWYYYRGGGCYSETKKGECLNKAHDHKSVKKAVEDYEAEIGKEVETNRYYFLMPNGSNGEKGDDNDSYNETYGKFAPSWYNEYSDTPAIYWWDENTVNPELYPGYSVERGDSECVFYADIPKEVTTIIWNNNITNSLYFDHLSPYAMKSINIMCEYYDPGESDNYPNGTENFDEMIFVVDPDYISLNDFTLVITWAGEWYYYYGNGCYGFEKDGDEHNCLRDDHDHAVGSFIGDVDGDGILSVLDATVIQRDVAKSTTLTDEQKTRADFNHDGLVTVLDATAIQRKVAKLD